MSLYPEHDKLKKIATKSQAIGEFVEEFLPSKGIQLATFEDDSLIAYPINTPIRNLLAEFFGIDQDKIEDEKRAMLDAVRKAG